MKRAPSALQNEASVNLVYCFPWREIKCVALLELLENETKQHRK